MENKINNLSVKFLENRYKEEQKILTKIRQDELLNECKKMRERAKLIGEK